MLRIDYRSYLFALIIFLTGCNGISLIPSAPVEYVETIEIETRTIPEEFLNPPPVPLRPTEAMSIEEGLNLGDELRTYSCVLFMRYSLVIEYFSEGEEKIRKPGADRCPEGTNSGVNLIFWK